MEVYNIINDRYTGYFLPNGIYVDNSKYIIHGTRYICKKYLNIERDQQCRYNVFNIWGLKLNE